MANKIWQFLSTHSDGCFYIAIIFLVSGFISPFFNLPCDFQTVFLGIGGALLTLSYMLYKDRKEPEPKEEPKDEPKKPKIIDKDTKLIYPIDDS